ncbi:MAG: serine hydrolase [Spirochaetaceae bacterium]|nr:serine hydrolase [Spirochaetaceae bacterium]
MAGDLGDRLAGAVRRLIAGRQLAGAVTVVARAGKIVHLQAHGTMDIARERPMADDTIFRIYSMTKAVGTVAAMLLCEQGSLELDAPAADYLPALGRVTVAGDAAGGETTAAPRRAMTVRDLLRHTSGLPGNVAVNDRFRATGLPPLAECTLEEIGDHLDRVPLLYHPGGRWYYSVAADVVGRLVEVASGQRFDEFLRQRIFAPLGMVDTDFFCPPHKADRLAEMYGPDPAGGIMPVDAPQGGTVSSFSFRERPRFLSCGGGLVSTGPDYLRFCLMLAGGGALGGVRLLRPETVARMTRNQLPAALLPIRKAPQERYDGLGFGLGFSVRVAPSGFVPGAEVGEYGWIGGASTEFTVSPRSGLVIITLTQFMPFSPLSRMVKKIVYDALEEDT